MSSLNAHGKVKRPVKHPQRVHSPLTIVETSSTHTEDEVKSTTARR